MRIGIISDIHADIRSLEAAFALLQDRGADRVVCAGDLVEKGEHGDDVVALLSESWIPCVKGNHDDNAVNHEQLRKQGSFYLPEDDDPPLQDETIQYLQNLPEQRYYEWEGYRVLIAHATPSSLHANLFHDPAEGLFAKSFKRDLLRAHVDIMILGHTHTPLEAYFRGVAIYNPGSICNGRPRDSHTCAILTLPSGQFEVIHVATKRSIEPMRVAEG